MTTTTVPDIRTHFADIIADIAATAVQRETDRELPYEAVRRLRIEPTQDRRTEIGDGHQTGTVKGTASVTAFTGKSP